jgi:hypothetical protein
MRSVVMNVKICNINCAYQNITRNAFDFRKLVLVYSVIAATWQNIQTAGKTECHWLKEMMTTVSV